MRWFPVNFRKDPYKNEQSKLKIKILIWKSHGRDSLFLWTFCTCYVLFIPINGFWWIYCSHKYTIARQSLWNEASRLCKSIMILTNRPVCKFKLSRQDNLNLKELRNNTCKVNWKNYKLQTKKEGRKKYSTSYLHFFS